MSTTLATPTPAPVPTAPPVAAPAPAVVPTPQLGAVIDVGTPAPNVQPGEFGSELRPVYENMAGTAPSVAPSDNQVSHDFLAARALAQAGNPWDRLNALIGPSAAGQQNAPQPGQAGGAAEGQPGVQAPRSAAGGRAPTPVATDDDRPIGRKLIDAPQDIEDEEEDQGEQGLDLSSLVPALERAAKDIGVGAIETPQAVLRGLLGAGQQLTGGLHSVQTAIDQVLPQWMAESLPMFAALRPLATAGTGAVSGALGAAKEAIPEPSTVTGGLIEQGTQFGAGLAAPGGAAEATGLTGVPLMLMKDMIAGATTMDPNAPRLSNVIDEVAPNFLTDWLKAKPGQDTQLMGRLKSGLEFAGLGAMFEGLRTGLGVLKGAFTGPKGEFPAPSSLGRGKPGTVETGMIQRPGAPTGEAPEGVLPQGWTAPNVPLVEINPKIQGMAETTLEGQMGIPPPHPETGAGAPPGGEGATFTGDVKFTPEQVADYVEGRTTDNPIRINLLRIGSGEDIQNALEQVARTIPEPSVVSNEATIRAADASGLSPADFLNGYKGQNLNASQTTAMRFMLDSSAQQLIDYAKAAADPLTASPEAKATFLKAFATHRALQQYFVNARAEAGRTLQSWAIMSQQRAGYTRAVQQLIEQAGEQNVDQMAANIASLDDPLQVSRLVAASDRGTGRDTFLKLFYNTLLSNPRTIVKKLSSDGSMVMWNLATNYAAERLGSGAVAPGETAQLAYGYMKALPDAIRIAGRGLKAGRSEFFGQFQTMDWMDKSRLSLLANGAPEMIPDEAPTQAGASWLRAALPTSWIGAADDFAKYLNYRAYAQALSLREGVSRGLEGPDLATHVAQTLDNIPDSIHQQALAQSLRSTFQEPLTGIAAQFETMVDAFNIPVAHTEFQIPAGRILMPFVKVPINIAKWSYRNSAVAVGFPSRAFQSELSAGGASRDLAMAKVWLGSAAAMGMADLALNNTITGGGPRDPQLRQAWLAAGNQPYSIQFPGTRPVSFNMTEPFARMIGDIADTFNVMKFAREDGRENLAAALTLSVGHSLLAAPYLEGLSNLFDGMNDPEHNGDHVATSMLLPFMTPQGVAQAAHAIDPYMRSYRTLLEAEESRLPIVSERLPPDRSLWGDPIPQRDAYLPFMPTNNFVPRFISPWQLGPKPEDVQPIDTWIWDNRASFPRATSNQLGITKPGEFQSFEVGHGVSVQAHLDPTQLDRFKELAGNGLKNPGTGLGAKDLLNGLVSGASSDTGMQGAWDKASDAERALIVQRVVNRYRAAAKEKLLYEFPTLMEAVTEGAKARAAQLRPQ